jgi:hypothetical protein
MDKAWNAPFEVGLDRDHIAATALSNQRFLQVWGVLRIGQDAIQFLLEAFVDSTHFTTQPGQLGAGLVHDLSLLTDTTCDLFRQIRTGFDACCDIGQQRDLLLKVSQNTPYPSSHTECALDIEEILGLQKASALGVSRKWTDVMHATHRESAMVLNYVSSLTRFL